MVLLCSRGPGFGVRTTPPPLATTSKSSEINEAAQVILSSRLYVGYMSIKTRLLLFFFFGGGAFNQIWPPPKKKKNLITCLIYELNCWFTCWEKCAKSMKRYLTYHFNDITCKKMYVYLLLQCLITINPKCVYITTDELWCCDKNRHLKLIPCMSTHELWLEVLCRDLCAKFIERITSSRAVEL